MNIQNGLTRAEKQAIIIASVKACANVKNANWANLAQVGAAVRKKGLKYGNLKPMLQSFAHILEFDEIYEHHAPVTYVRLKK